MQLLDIATGGGHTANAFAPLVKHVIAYDLTPEILSAAKAFIVGNGLTNVEFVQGDAELLPFAVGSFDRVTCRIAAHHFPQLDAFVTETARVLRPDGRLLLIDNVAPEDDEWDTFYNEVEKRRDPSHFRAWKKSEWIRRVEQAGLTIELMMTFEKTFKFDNWCDRMNLPQAEKEELTRIMLQASEKVRNHFRIVSEENRIVSFQGESILLKAREQYVLRGESYELIEVYLEDEQVQSGHVQCVSFTIHEIRQTFRMCRSELYGRANLQAKAKPE